MLEPLRLRHTKPYLTCQQPQNKDDCFVIGFGIGIAFFFTLGQNHQMETSQTLTERSQCDTFSRFTKKFYDLHLKHCKIVLTKNRRHYQKYPLPTVFGSEFFNALAVKSPLYLRPCLKFTFWTIMG